MDDAQRAALKREIYGELAEVYAGMGWKVLSGQFRDIAKPTAADVYWIPESPGGQYARKGGLAGSVTRCIADARRFSTRQECEDWMRENGMTHLLEAREHMDMPAQSEPKPATPAVTWADCVVGVRFRWDGGAEQTVDTLVGDDEMVARLGFELIGYNREDWGRSGAIEITYRPPPLPPGLVVVDSWDEAMRSRSSEARAYWSGGDLIHAFAQYKLTNGERWVNTLEGREAQRAKMGGAK